MKFRERHRSGSDGLDPGASPAASSEQAPPFPRDAMTFSLVARCAETGMVGAAVASSARVSKRRVFSAMMFSSIATRMKGVAVISLFWLAFGAAANAQSPRVADYRPVFELCRDAGGGQRLAIRAMTRGGAKHILSVDPQTLAAYALYFSKFVQAWRAEGINLYAIYPQNEPLLNDSIYPQCKWSGEELNRGTGLPSSL